MDQGAYSSPRGTMTRGTKTGASGAAWAGVALGVFALILAILALILYGTVPQPVKPRVTTVSITSSPSGVDYTPKNGSLAKVTVGANNNIVTIKNVPKGYTFSLLNTDSQNTLKVNGVKPANSTLSPNQGGLYIVDESGTPHLIAK